MVQIIFILPHCAIIFILLILKMTRGYKCEDLENLRGIVFFEEHLYLFHVDINCVSLDIMKDDTMCI